MLKIIAAGVTALFVTASPVAYAQAQSPGERGSTAQAPSPEEQGSAAGSSDLTDARINIVKTTLGLTPDQEKYWPAVEEAIRNGAMDRQARIANAVQQLGELHDRGVILVLRERSPVDFLRHRADAFAQRAADLKKLADAWEPLYQTLTPDQRHRMAFLEAIVVRDMRNAAEQRRVQSVEDELE